MTELALTLEHCETQIQSALDAAAEHFDVIGRNLRAVRDGELYKPQFSTFDEYVSERWGFTSNYARRLVAAAKVIENIQSVTRGTVEVDQPSSESQCREIAKSTSIPEKQAKIWSTAVAVSADGNPSSKVIRRAAEIVHVEPVVNVESAEIDAALREFVRLVEKLTTTGKRIQSAFDAKYVACAPMQSRRKKYTSRIEYLAERVELLREGIDTLAKEWAGTKRQVDE